MTYSIQYTISVLSGQYAQKYSIIWYDAQRFVTLFGEYAPDLIELPANPGQNKPEFDPYVVFQTLMKALKSLAKKQSEMAVFKDDLMNMLNLCEEAMAKDGKLVAHLVSNDTPAPPPLFRL